MAKSAEAIEHWKESLRIDPNQSEALYSLATALRKRHDPEAQHYLQLFSDLEQREEISNRIGMLRSFALQSGKAQNWPTAITDLKQAIQLCEQCAEAALLHKNLAFFYEQVGDIISAEHELKQTLAIDPRDTKAQQALAQLQGLSSAQPRSHSVER